MSDWIERERFEFSQSGRDFVLEEFTGKERRRYARKILELTAKTRKAAEAEVAKGFEIDLGALSDVVMAQEEEFVAWILSLGSEEPVTADWVSEHLTATAQKRVMAKVDEINQMEEHVGNVFSRLAEAQAALTQRPIG